MHSRIIEQPKAASISFGIALIPAEPIYSEVAEASTTIAKLCENRNLIDNCRFPCHASLILSGANHKGIRKLAAALRRYRNVDACPVSATNVYSGKRGFIGVRLTGLPLMSEITSLVRSVVEEESVCRPHLLAKWVELGEEQRSLVRQFGSYHIGSRLDPHLSVAQVSPDLLEQMLSLAREKIHVPMQCTFASLQLVDIGHHNEKWDVIAEVGLAMQ